MSLTPCPRCGGPRVLVQHRGQPEARCRACHAAHGRMARPASEPLLAVVRRVLDFGVPMGGNAGELVCSFCGQPWEQVRGEGHREDCLWIALRDAAVREAR